MTWDTRWLSWLVWVRNLRDVEALKVNSTLIHHKFTTCSILADPEDLPSGRGGTSRAASSDDSRTIRADIVSAARDEEVGVVRNTWVADWFCGAAVGEEDAYAWIYAGTASDDRAGAACTSKPNEIGSKCWGSGYESAGEERDLELHFD